MALLTAKENGFQGKSGTPLEEWLPVQIAKNPGLLKKHLIPARADLWRVEHFDKFIEARKELILEKFKDYIQTPAS